MGSKTGKEGKERKKIGEEKMDACGAIEQPAGVSISLIR
jgi:hypothetical protein